MDEVKTTRDRKHGRGNLSVYPTHSNKIVNGVKYKTYFKTDWTEILTEDGVSLKDLLNNLPDYGDESVYHYKGILRNTPSQRAIDQLYGISSPRIGEVRLVESDYKSDDKFVCEVYVYLGDNGWVFHGTTDRKATIQNSLPSTLKLIPSELGEADQFMVVSSDGKSITWANPIKVHDNDPNAHMDIRRLIEDVKLNSNKVRFFNDTISKSNWTYNGTSGYYEYIYTSPNFSKNTYFQIDPIIENKSIAKAIAKALINPSYKISAGKDFNSYAILTAESVPSVDIDISIKVFGEIITE